MGEAMDEESSRTSWTGDCAPLAEISPGVVNHVALAVPRPAENNHNLLASGDGLYRAGDEVEAELLGLVHGA